MRCSNVNWPCCIFSNFFLQNTYPRCGIFENFEFAEAIFHHLNVGHNSPGKFPLPGSFSEGIWESSGSPLFPISFQPLPSSCQGSLSDPVFRHRGRQLNSDPELFLRFFSHSTNLLVSNAPDTHKSLGFLAIQIFFYSGYYLVFLDPGFIIFGIVLDKAIMLSFFTPLGLQPTSILPAAPRTLRWPPDAPWCSSVARRSLPLGPAVWRPHGTAWPRDPYQGLASCSTQRCFYKIIPPPNTHNFCDFLCKQFAGVLLL